MCGIIGYNGYDDVTGILIKGLKKLEYRGYDSVGIAVYSEKYMKSVITKCVGRVEALAENIGSCIKGHMGIGHTRWATHGEVCAKNSHPHKFGKVTVVHNGIIENYESLKTTLGVADKLVSRTDSEVAAALMDKNYNGDPVSAVISAVKQLRGTYAFAVMFDDIPDAVYVVRNISPIVCCVNDSGSYFASDIMAIGEYSDEYFVLPESAVAEIGKNGIRTVDFSGKVLLPKKLKTDKSIAENGKDGYPFYMEKEISEQPEAIERTVKKYINNGIPDFSCDGVDDTLFLSCSEISIVACGTALNAGLVGKYIIEKYSGVPVSIYMASEFMYSEPIISEKTLVICVSQSGETIDTLESLKFAKKKGASVLSIVNVRNSSIARECKNVIYTEAGPEIAVASTKAYTTQLSILYLIASKLAFLRKKLTRAEIISFMTEFEKVPDSIREVLKNKKNIHVAAKHLLEHEHAFMIGRCLDHSVLVEASLKLKEISYIHSEAFASGELKHGTIALISEGTPVVALVTQSDVVSKQISNIREVMARGADVMAFIGADVQIEDVGNIFRLPRLRDEFSVFPAITALQLLAYYVASDKGLDVDKPRNLAKVVTVE